MDIHTVSNKFLVFGSKYGFLSLLSPIYTRQKIHLFWHMNDWIMKINTHTQKSAPQRMSFQAVNIIYVVLSRSTNSYNSPSTMVCVCVCFCMESNVIHIDVTSTRSRINHFWHSNNLWIVIFFFTQLSHFCLFVECVCRCIGILLPVYFYAHCCWLIWLRLNWNCSECTFDTYGMWLG